LEYSAALIRRLAFIDVYQSSPAISLDSGATKAYMTDFDSYLADLCSKILEFQARAICYLWKHRVSRTLRDTFKRDGWDALLTDLKEGENMVEKYISRVEGASHAESLKRIEANQVVAARWNALSAREKLVQSFLEQLYAGTCHYRDAKSRNDERVADTCEWFISHARFLEWTENKESALLWVSADPGCGKSVLARYLVDDVLPSTSETTLCYFFFKDDFPDQKGATNALCAILRQIFLAKPHLLSGSLLVKAKIDGAKFTSSLSDLWSTFISVATDQNAGQFVITLDALDECRDSDRSLLIKNIRELYSHGSQPGTIKFLMTSRPYHHIKAEFRELAESLPTIHLGHLNAESEVEVDKISREIDLVIDYCVEKISRERNLQESEQKYLQEQIKKTDKSQRTYLWVTLVLDVIKNKPGFSRGKVRQSLGEIPKKLDDAYEKILARSPDQAGARKLLSILVAATRPLSVDEMSLMSAVEQKHQLGGDLDDYLENNFQETIRATCGLFVVIIDAKVYLLHQTAREFLVPNEGDQKSSLSTMNALIPWRGSILPGSSNRLLAEICIRYIYHLEENRFRGLEVYSANNWAVHSNKWDMQNHQDIMLLAKALCDPTSAQYKLWSRTGKNFEQPLNLASHLGLAPIVAELIDEHSPVNIMDKFGNTPLSWAAREGFATVTQLLLNAGASVELVDNTKWTSLHRAAHCGHTPIVVQLIAAGADVNAITNYDETPLQLASEAMHEDTVKVLVNSGADINAKSRSKSTALSRAVGSAELGIIQTLLHAGALVNDTISASGITAIHGASSQGHDKVVQILLGAGADVDARDLMGETPLSLAAEYGYTTVIHVLLAGGAQVDATDTQGRTPLSRASENKHEDVVQLLLKAGARTDLKIEAKASLQS
jgi:ankyrin repeat protein